MKIEREQLHYAKGQLMWRQFYVNDKICGVSQSWWVDGDCLEKYYILI